MIANFQIGWHVPRYWLACGFIGGEQRCEAEELCDELDLARTTLQAASLAVVLDQQPQQASCRHDQNEDDAQRC